MVLAARRAAVADEMLGRGDHLAWTQEILGARRCPAALRPSCRRRSERLAGSSRKALIGSAPAIVAHHGQGRREVPVDPGRRPSRWAVTSPMRRISSGSRVAPRPIFCGKDGRSDDVRVAVHRVDTPHQRDALAIPIGSIRRIPERVGQLQPVRRRRLFIAPGERCCRRRGSSRTCICAHLLGRDAV